jgi:ferredoxin
MPQITINKQILEVAAGTTILQAAQAAGIEIPTLCHCEGMPPQTSCMLCVVQESTSGRNLPACAAPATEGMRIETHNETLRTVRREILELLLSEHAGDCEAPCRRMCPAGMNIPFMLRCIGQGRNEEAARIALDALVLPVTLSYVCKAPCETGCRRKTYDEAVAIRELHRPAATDYTPTCADDTGKTVAIVGSGPAGLAAAWILRRHGHQVTVFDTREAAGGVLRDLEALPAEVLNAELEVLQRMGIAFSLDCASMETSEYQATHDAVVSAEEEKMVVRSIAQGKAAGRAANDVLMNMPPAPETYDSTMGRLERCGIDALSKNRMDAADLERGRDAGNARAEAKRCLHCDCATPVSCKLRKYATEYGADRRAYPGSEMPSLARVEHGAGVWFEPGKCVKCGICVAITRAAGAKLGLGFAGRGFAVKVTVPLGGALKDALEASARECVDKCPTGALAFAEEEEFKPPR